MTDTLAPAGIDTSDSPHYLRALTDMADRRTVVADAAIYTDKGIKLVEKGARIDSRLYDRLVQHKLREPIDRHLSIENPVDVPALLAAGQAMSEQEVLPSLLAEALGSAARLLAPLRSLPLPPSMACKHHRDARSAARTVSTQPADDDGGRVPGHQKRSC
jgi:hypothetical protein